MKDYINIEISKLHAFAGHPYKVLDNREMDALTESVREHGVMSPLIVRPLEGATDEYEVISGQIRSIRVGRNIRVPKEAVAEYLSQ